MDMIGKRIDMLEVVEKLPGSKYRCLCDCGGQKILRVGHFNTGKMKSCGCHWRSAKPNSRELISYANMMARCHNPKNKRFADYGAKGLLVDESWRNNFQQFYKDMGDCPDKFQIDRIDNTKGYSKENCRWVDAKENMSNRSISRIWVVEGVEFLSGIEAAKSLNVNVGTIYAWCKGRLARGVYYKPRENCYFRYVYPKLAQCQC